MGLFGITIISDEKFMEYKRMAIKAETLVRENENLTELISVKTSALFLRDKEISDLKKEIDFKNKELLSAGKQLSDSSSEIVRLRETQKKLLKSVKAKQEDLNKANDEIEALERDNAIKREDINVLNRKLSMITSKYAALMDSLKDSEETDEAEVKPEIAPEESLDKAGDSQDEGQVLSSDESEIPVSHDAPEESYCKEAEYETEAQDEAGESHLDNKPDTAESDMSYNKKKLKKNKRRK